MSDWKALQDDVAPFIGERAASLFAFSVADASGSDEPAGQLRAELVARGDDPEQPHVTEAEQLLLDWGRLLGSGSAVPADMSGRLEATFRLVLREKLPQFAAAILAA